MGDRIIDTLDFLADRYFNRLLDFVEERKNNRKEKIHENNLKYINEICEKHNLDEDCMAFFFYNYVNDDYFNEYASQHIKIPSMCVPINSEKNIYLFFSYKDETIYSKLTESYISNGAIKYNTLREFDYYRPQRTNIFDPTYYEDIIQKAHNFLSSSNI